MKIANAFLAALLFLLFSSPQALAEKKGIWIASGPPGGTYRDVYAPNLGNLMRGYELLYLSSGGSGGNLEMLAKGEADLAFAQADVFAELYHSDPDRYGNLTVIGRLADECVFFAYRKDGPIKTLKQLANPVKGRIAKVAVGSKEGGMSGTWKYFAKLMPGLASASTTNDSGTLSLNQLAVGEFDVVGWVTDPTNFNHKMLRAAAANESLALMDLKDPALTKVMSNRTRVVYKSRKFKLSDSWRAPNLETVCTFALVFAREDADAKMVERVADLLSLKLNSIVPPQASPQY